MRPSDLVADLTGRGITLAVEGDHLAIEGDNDILTDAIVEELRTHKPEIIRLLRCQSDPDLHELFEERAGIMEHDAGLPQAIAERLASLDVLNRGRSPRAPGRDS